MIPFKYQAIIFTCVAIFMLIIGLIGGLEDLNKVGSLSMLFSQSLVTYFYIATTAFCIYEAIRLYLKLKQGGRIKEESRILVKWTTFIMIMIYRYYLVLF